MRLLEAHIDGFGQLNNRRIELDAPVIIVFGPNEAGKSTVFGFLRSMLYGFARRNLPAERLEPIAGGRHGGRLLFSDDGNATYSVERYADGASGKLRLKRLGDGNDQASVLPEDGLVEQAIWEKQFLGGVNERLFRHLYAITLSELREAGALSGEELGRYLYQAGWEEGRAVAYAEKKIAAELEGLFKPKGTSQKLYLGAKTVESLDSELRSLGDGIAEYNELLAEEEAAELEMAKLESSLEETGSSVRLLRKATAVRALWLRRIELLAEREGIAYAGLLPAGMEQTWQKLQEERAIAGEQVSQLSRDKALRGSERELLVFDESLILLEKETSALLESSGRMRELRQQRNEWENERRSLDEVIGSMMASISPHWTERQLRQLAVTVPDRDYVRAYRESLSASQRKAERLTGELETYRLQIREQAESVSSTKGRLQAIASGRRSAGAGFSLLPLSSSQLTAAWNALDEALRLADMETARRQSEFQPAAGAGHSSGQRIPLVLPVLGLSLGAVALAAAATGITGEGSLAAWVAAAALLAASTTLLSLNRRRDAGSARDGAKTRRGANTRRGTNRTGYGDSTGHAVREALAELIEQSVSAADEIIGRINGDEGMAEALQLRSKLKTLVQETVNGLQEESRIELALAEAQRKLHSLEQYMNERQETLQKLEEEMADSSLQWRSWLGQRALPDSMSPSAVLETFELAESALQHLRQYDRLAERIEYADGELRAYTMAVSSLCEKSPGFSLQGEREEATILRLLQAEIERHTAAQEKALELEAAMRELDHELGTAMDRRTVLEEERHRLFQNCGLSSDEAMAQAIRDGSKLKELDDESMKLGIEFNAGLLPEFLHKLEALLESADEETLGQKLVSSQTHLDFLRDRQRELLERRGSRRAELDRLLQSSRRQRLLEEREMAQASLKGDMERYAVLSVSQALITATRRKYEQERQPAVLRNASTYIAQLTEGRYHRVLASPERAAIELENNRHMVIDSAMLSRGTAEQLYLCMRLALAREVAGGNKLPLLLDDLFVNFDRRRLRASAQLVSGLSAERQIVLFTCHEHIRDELLAANPSAKLLDIGAVQTA
ncbi:AAA family ATPase [Paenibacillus sp. CAU 1782]